MVRKEAIKQAEKERCKKFKKQEEERDLVRQKLRDKYNIEKPVNEDDFDDDDDEDNSFGIAKKKEDDAEVDPVASRYTQKWW